MRDPRPRGVTRRISDNDLETRDFGAKRRPRVTEDVFRPPGVSETPGALRVAVSNVGWSREENASGWRLHKTAFFRQTGTTV